MEEAAQLRRFQCMKRMVATSATLRIVARGADKEDKGCGIKFVTSSPFADQDTLLRTE